MPKPHMSYDGVRHPSFFRAILRNLFLLSHDMNPEAFGYRLSEAGAWVKTDFEEVEADG